MIEVDDGQERGTRKGTIVKSKNADEALCEYLWKLRITSTCRNGAVD